MANEQMTNALAELEIAPRQTIALTGNQRSRLLNFLLRWEHVEELHAQHLEAGVPRWDRRLGAKDWNSGYGMEMWAH